MMALLPECLATISPNRPYTNTYPAGRRVRRPNAKCPDRPRPVRAFVSDAIERRCRYIMRYMPAMPRLPQETIVAMFVGDA